MTSTAPATVAAEAGSSRNPSLSDEIGELSEPEFEWEDSVCPACLQTFNSQDKDWQPGHKSASSQDCPSNHNLLVIPSRANERCLCSKCFYCKRGSFPKMTTSEFVKILKKIPAISSKFLDVSVSAGLNERKNEH